MKKLFSIKTLLFGLLCFAWILVKSEVYSGCAALYSNVAGDWPEQPAPTLIPPFESVFFMNI